MLPWHASCHLCTNPSSWGLSNKGDPWSSVHSSNTSAPLFGSLCNLSCWGCTKGIWAHARSYFPWLFCPLKRGIRHFWKERWRASTMLSACHRAWGTPRICGLRHSHYQLVSWMKILEPGILKNIINSMNNSTCKHHRNMVCFVKLKGKVLIFFYWKKKLWHK